MSVVHGDEGACSCCGYALAGVTEHDWDEVGGPAGLLCVVCSASALHDLRVGLLADLASVIGVLANAMIDAHGPGYRAEVERPFTVDLFDIVMIALKTEPAFPELLGEGVELVVGRVGDEMRPTGTAPLPHRLVDEHSHRGHRTEASRCPRQPRTSSA